MAPSQRTGPLRYAEWVPADQVPPLGAMDPVPIAPPASRPSGHADRLVVDADAGQIWTLVYNGADGDDWSRSNHGTEIALRHPLTPERAQLVAELRAEYQDTEEYRAAGVRRARQRSRRSCTSWESAPTRSRRPAAGLMS